jgi:two-component system chemotaxis sensor kinase CheA
VLLDALDFIRQDGICAIFAPDSSWQEQQQFLQTLNDQTLAAVLGARWQATYDSKTPAQAAQPNSAVPAHSKAEQLKEKTAVRDSAADSGRGQKLSDQRMMRLPAYKLDTLVNQLGELLIATATLHEHSRRSNQPEIIEQVQQVQQLVDDIQSSALQLRMVQIGETFNRFQRVVHDIAAELGKDVQLVIEGADAELDKSVVERISDPLMHLVRNALDHGLETPAQRQLQGKTAQGTLLLRAYHDSGSIVIEISDDGRGIDREKVRQKAIDRGLINAANELSHRQIDELIFEPGFSTADAVSNLSGRGVGMDVVKRNIEALRGTVDINSEPGAGTQFHLRLPLTLAIIDGFMVRIGSSKFVIPLDMVNECIELPVGQDQATAGAGYLNLRGEVLPFIHLHQLFGLGSTTSERRSIVVVRYGKQSAGLVVDQLLGEFQTVIKPLGKLFQFLQGISGSSILGSGDIALILDIPRLVQIHMQATERQRTTMVI